MKTLTFYSPSYKDATSFYRAVGPLQELKKKMGFLLSHGSDTNWATLKGSDAVFMQRPYANNQVQILEMAQANGLKVWVDYDDDLFTVPRSNRAFRLYGDQKVQNNIAQIVACADVVTVSTPALQRKLQEILILVGKGAPDFEGLKLDPNKIHVVPNAYDEKFCFYAQKKHTRKPKKLIAWRGSETHDKDLMAFTQPMKEALGKHLDWTFNFIGSPFWHTIEEMESVEGAKETNIIHTDNLDPVEFFKFLYLTAPALVIVPLWDCEFNRSKSNIAYIEAMHAGACCLAPDWEEWRRPGVINYKDAADFGEKLQAFMRGEFDSDKLHFEGWNYVKSNLTLNKVNIIREILLRELWS